MNSSRRNALQSLRALGVDPFPARCRRTHAIAEALSGPKGRCCTLVGRLVEWRLEVRGQGSEEFPIADCRLRNYKSEIRNPKSEISRAPTPDPRPPIPRGSGVLWDQSGPVRLTVESSGLTEADRKFLPHLQAGDIVEVTGALRSDGLEIRGLRLLTKALRPMEGTTDWVRFQADDGQLRRNLVARARIVTAIRRFFEKAGFVEVETPLLVRCPGMEPHLVAFETAYRDDRRQERLYLPTSPEYAMKRLLSAGFERIFQICKAFRNAEQGAQHQPEFTMLEWYRAYASYEEIMADCEGLISSVALEVLGEPHLTWQGTRIDLLPPYPRLTVREAMRRYVGIDLQEVQDRGAFYRAARGRGFSNVAPDDDWETTFFKLFLDAVEPKLGFPKPTFLSDYPASMGALAKCKAGDPTIAERFELYIAGVELANAFTELNDPEEQRGRFLREMEEKRALGLPVYPLDGAFLSALEVGLPPSGGIALGVDRLAMLLLDAADVREVLAFPWE